MALPSCSPKSFIYLQRLKVSDWFVNNMLAWGEEDYLEELDLISFLKFLVTVPKARVYDGLLHLQTTLRKTLQGA